MKYTKLFYLLLLSANISATELTLTPPFLDNDKIQFDSIPMATGGHDLVGFLVSKSGIKTSIPVHCPSEGGDAEIGNAYTLNAPAKLLIVTCRYQVNHSGLGIKGTNYSTRVLEAKKGTLHQRPDIELLLSGYEGTSEDGSRSYFFYDDQSLATLKLQSASNDQTSDQLELAHKIAIKRLNNHDYDAINYYASPKRITDLLNEFPLSQKNIRLYNDIGFALSESGNQSEALRLLYAVEQEAPKRTVLLLNIADALWNSESKEKSKLYYSKYQSMMRAQDKKILIPSRVKERLSSSQ